MPTTQYFSLLPNNTDLYNLNPAPVTGQGPYGKVPGTIGVPPNLYKGVSSIYPGLAGQTAAISNLINSQARGEFTPETENAMWDAANRFGVGQGMPGTNMTGAGIWGNKYMGNRAGAVEAMQQKAIENYQNVTGKLAQLVDNPELLATIAARNATMGAAPDPAQAAAEQQRIYNEAMQKVIDQISATKGPAGGTINTVTRGPSYGGGGGGGFPPVQTYTGPAAGTRANMPTLPTYAGRTVVPATGPGSGNLSWLTPEDLANMYNLSDQEAGIEDFYPSYQSEQYAQPIGPELTPWNPTQYDYAIGPGLTDFGTPPAGVPADYWYTGEDWGEPNYYAPNDWSGFEDWIP